MSVIILPSRHHKWLFFRLNIVSLFQILYKEGRKRRMRRREGGRRKGARKE